MQDTVFREYDIRGIVDSEFSFSDIYQLGRAIFAYCLDQKKIKTVLLGQDGRVSSPIIAQHIINAALDSGLDVVHVGIVPSPVVYFGMHEQKGDIGIMITASHNPGHYNGIKIMLGERCVWGKEIQLIKQYFTESKKANIGKIGVLYQDKDFLNLYIDYLVKHFPILHNSPLPVIFDCGNAVAGVVMPLLIQKFNWAQATLLYETIDGSFPVHEADPTVEKNMQHLKDAVIHNAACVGIGFDGDADRMAAVSETGALFLGDVLLAIFATALPKSFCHLGIVFNVTMSSALQELCAQHNMPVFMAPTGHAIIKESMKKNKAVLGGEGSCHFFFADRYFGYDDGIYAALRLLEIISLTGKKVSELAAVLPKRYSSCEYRIACADQYKKFVVAQVKDAFMLNNNARLLTIDGVRAEFAIGWGIVRAANTQPAVSMRFESTTKEGLLEIKNLFYAILKPYLGPPLDIIFKDSTHDQ
ncbi:phosphomannomutase/phosphoglucomutase [Candidatus Dependentiae bacterium]|nr:MAG: phosphomannomutase/phosphoglucomutase [Candidatus Dependentiae bacterium]